MYAGDLFCRVGVYTPSPEATCVLCTQAYVIKITKFRDLGTPLIAIFTSAVREPAHSKGYNASPPPKKKTGWTPLLQKSKPEIHVHSLYLAATMTGYLCREVRTDLSYGYIYLAYDLG